MKVQVNLSEELVQKIDEYAKKMGVSRSSLCGVWIGQAVFNLENSQRIMTEMLQKKDGFMSEMLQKKDGF